MGRHHEEKIEIMRKYLGNIANGFAYHIEGDIPGKKIDNAIKKFASGMDRTSVIGFFDTTVMGNGKNGYIFTDDKVYYLDTLEKPKKFWYDDIKAIRITNTYKKDCDRILEITQYEEEKFHARQGHGFAAERANTLYDNFTGHDAEIVGDDNAKNGADRIVDGVYIQSKYCATGSRCINECFEEDGKGAFRYMIDGKPMQIEVPSDKYDEALNTMEEKIRNGQVKGVNDPEEAKSIVRKGHFTYTQAKNIAEAGTVEPLTYDAVNGAIIATSAFGVTAMITLATSLAAQLSKAGLNSALVGSSEAIVSMMGPIGIGVSFVLIPIIEKETAKRRIIYNLSTEQMINSVKIVLEEINDTLAEDGQGIAFA